MKNLLRLACFASLSLAAILAHAETYAVMIGICDYQDGKDAAGNAVSHKLTGCVNDIKSYQDVLVKKFAVKPDNIHLLLDKDANKAGFLDNMKWLLSSAKPGDQVMFFYSGHGTQFDSDKEADGKEEAIILQDNCLVTGNFFHEVSQSLSKAGMNATFVFDSCFSGGMTRDAALTLEGKSYAPRQRYTKPAELKNATHFSPETEKALKGIPKKKSAQQPAGSYAFVLASAETEPSIDLQSKDPSVPSHGLFTLVFANLLESLPDAPVSDMVAAITKYFKEHDLKQTPGTEFSSEARGQQPFYLKG